MASEDLLRIYSSPISAVELNMYKSAHKSQLHLTLSLVFPQGSVLGTLFFIIYVNDLLLCADSNFTLFADDTILEKIPSFDLTRLNGSIEKID